VKTASEVQITAFCVTSCLGYEFFAERQLVTVFSAPNYCGEFDNKGAVMFVNSDLLCSFGKFAHLTPDMKMVTMY
jgi:hypothetical protein